MSDEVARDLAGEQDTDQGARLVFESAIRRHLLQPLHVDSRHKSQASDPPAADAPVQILTVIVNYRSAPLTIACLESLAEERQRVPGMSVVVVDNESGDDSVAMLRTAVDQNAWHAWVEIRPTGRNGGFAFGVNAGVMPSLRSGSPADAYWLLNPDTYVRPGALVALLDFLREHPEASIVGSRLENPDGSPQQSRFRFPCLQNETADAFRLDVLHRWVGDRATLPPMVDTAHEIDWLAGASMLIRRQVFESIGGFDDGYFLYFEELDFCRRAKNAGFRTWYVPQSRVVHLVGQSTGVTRRDGDAARPGRTPRYWWESRRRYYAKHHSLAYRLIASAVLLFGRTTWHARRLLRRRPNTDPPHYLRDFVLHGMWPWPARTGR